MGSCAWSKLVSSYNAHTHHNALRHHHLHQQQQHHSTSTSHLSFSHLNCLLFLRRSPTQFSAVALDQNYHFPSSLSSSSSSSTSTEDVLGSRRNKIQTRHFDNVDEEEIEHDDQNDDNESDSDIEQNQVQYFFSEYIVTDKEQTRTSNKKIFGYVDQILPTVRSVILKDNQENPADIVRLKQIAKQESLWIPIIFRLIDKIEINDPLGPPIIAIFLEETPLPSKEQTLLLVEKMAFGHKEYPAKIERNILVILSCLSEKVAGTSIALIVMEKTLNFIFSLLESAKSMDESKKLTAKKLAKLNVLLFSIITLEKFSMSSQCKLMISTKLNEKRDNVLNYLADWINDENHLKHQVGFSSQYLLDNIFSFDNHVYAYEKIEMNSINVRLNDDDTSENLKISPNGLEARNDTLSFESVRCTFQVDQGIWFYEVTLLTNGIMQIGFATKQSSFFNHQGFGIGDDLYSVAYDGCRRLIWHNAFNQSVKNIDTWKAGDTIGLLLDIDGQKISFYQNGKLITPIHTDFFRKVKNGIFPAASFMSFQHIVFNFGATPFKYPPTNVKFQVFNDFGRLSEENKHILPKRKKLEVLRKIQIKENACFLCCEDLSTVRIQPCKHENFCENCIKRLTSCPICRSHIMNYELV